METRLPLEDIRVLDLTWVLAGPYATRLLADFGADVLKVIPPNAVIGGDDFSQGYYETWNRNKRGISLDLDKETDLQNARELMRQFDVVMENFTPRVMDNWGLDYVHLKEIRPDIIVCRMSAYGQTGPYRDRSGFAPTVHAASGLTGMMRDGEGEPVGPGFSYADHIAGLYAAMAVLGALEYRDRTGEGQLIDISQTEAMLSLLGAEMLEFQATGKKPDTGVSPGVEIRDTADIMSDAGLRERGFLVDKPEIGKLVDASPVRLSETPAQYRKGAPLPNTRHPH